MTDHRATSATTDGKVLRERKVMSFRAFMEATRAGQHPETRPEQTKTAVQGSKRGKTVLRSVHDVLASRSTAGKSR
jgi:hypothetical protein